MVRAKDPSDHPASCARRRTKIRRTAQALQHPQLAFGAIRRQDALRMIKRYLGKNPVHPLAQSLIDLFHIHGEELTEAGISYEGVKALENHCPSLWR